MRRLCLLSTLSVVVALQGCSLAPGGSQAEGAAVTAIDKAKEDIRAFNDKKADVYMTLPCAISIGAYYRIDNAVKQNALQMLCSGKEIGAPTANLGTGVNTEPLPSVE